MADEELEMEDGGGKKNKMMLIIIIVAVLVVAGGGAFFFLGGSEPVPEAMPQNAGQGGAVPGAQGANVGTALYVAMPRPFIFNVPGAGRDRLVQIKVQLMVRGSDNEELAKMHIPMIEGTLLRVFSTSSADDLVTEVGKVAMRDQSLREVQKAMQEIASKDVVENVLFTGFVMQ
ncbi:flagellar basal body-associated protein FliL [Paraneptunicella aestuarii]|uniref:flagellar basal body-associated protein FliL n=1 Tax=Paraneptunicella aestuarii TaxID=2831148 RepID=UPI001E622415|nr:flagellar basal body-associated protein FliL [Paraneptunicella aestuarii]UAA38163.1 flagellar basal body-associated protein FliL [Paraneptunicella aestuarii]